MIDKNMQYKPESSNELLRVFDDLGVMHLNADIMAQTIASVTVPRQAWTVSDPPIEGSLWQD